MVSTPQIPPLAKGHLATNLAFQSFLSSESPTFPLVTVFIGLTRLNWVVWIFSWGSLMTLDLATFVYEKQLGAPFPPVYHWQDPLFSLFPTSFPYDGFAPSH